MCICNSTTAGVKIGIHFMSYSENSDEIIHEPKLSTILPSSLQRVEFIPKFHSLHMLSQINTIALL